MAAQKIPFCTDEELLIELKKLGYSDVSPDVFQMMKEDLTELVSLDQSHFRTLFNESKQKPHVVEKENLYQRSDYCKTTGRFTQPTKFLPDYQGIKSEEKISDELVLCSDRLKNYSNYKNNCSLKNCKPSSFFERSDDISFRDTETNPLITECESPSSSLSTDGNKIKRKVLRHEGGKPVITEEFLDIPSIFSSSYPETENLESKSSSSDGLSLKSNSPTGSISALNSNSTPRSTISVSSTRSNQSRVSGHHKKKNDPVTMYNYYKKFWNDFKPPGEKTHDKLRWAVRDKMLDYNL